MKPNRDANELAARLGAAASKPPPLPETPAPKAEERPTERKTPVKTVVKRKSQTVGISMRPSAALLNRYTLAAAERTRHGGRVVSAQEIMLEVLERGP